MFSGIVQAVGQIVVVEPTGGDVRLRVATGAMALTDVTIGDSIAVNGVCLTAVELSPHGFVADVSAETLAHTTLGRYTTASRVNLEKSLTLATPLGGHLVSGHVDGVGTVIAREPAARSVLFRIRVPATLSRYVARKGSVCINGVSLTVNDVRDNEFDVNIVPHTLQVTTLDELTVGSDVNIEVDLIARYVERMLTALAEGRA